MRPTCTHNFAEFPQKILQKIIYAERYQVLTFLLRQAAKSSGQVENAYVISTVNQPQLPYPLACYGTNWNFIMKYLRFSFEYSTKKFNFAAE